MSAKVAVPVAQARQAQVEVLPEALMLCAAATQVAMAALVLAAAVDTTGLSAAKVVQGTRQVAHPAQPLAERSDRSTAQMPLKAKTITAIAGVAAELVADLVDRLHPMVTIVPLVVVVASATRLPLWPALARIQETS